jgi:hypothetical protein
MHEAIPENEGLVRQLAVYSRENEQHAPRHSGWIVGPFYRNREGVVQVGFSGNNGSAALISRPNCTGCSQTHYYARHGKQVTRVATGSET